MKLTKKKLITQTILALLLIAPVLGILKHHGQALADIELGDPVVLAQSYPDFMGYFKVALYIAIACAFLPITRRLYGLCLGFCLGGLAFLYLDIKADVKSLSEMNLSQKPLEEMIQLTQSGQDFAMWCIVAVVLYLCVWIAESVFTMKHRLM